MIPRASVFPGNINNTRKWIFLKSEFFLMVFYTVDCSNIQTDAQNRTSVTKPWLFPVGLLKCDFYHKSHSGNRCKTLIEVDSIRRAFVLKGILETICIFLSHICKYQNWMISKVFNFSSFGSVLGNGAMVWRFSNTRSPCRVSICMVWSVITLYVRTFCFTQSNKAVFSILNFTEIMHQKGGCNINMYALV